MTSSIQNVAWNSKQLWPLTVDAYHALGDMGLIPEKTELLEGFVFHKMPKSPIHRMIIQRLIRHLNAAIRDRAGFWVQSEQPVRCGASEPEPDVSLIAGNEEDFSGHHPTTAELAVEVSLSTLEIDLAKAAIYAAAGVKEYWVVDVAAASVVIHRSPSAAGYLEKFAVTDVAESVMVPGFAAHIPTLLAGRIA